MSVDYALPEIVEPAKVQAKQVLLVANGDLRPAANQRCWPAQAQMEDSLHQAVNDAGFELVRGASLQAETGARIYRFTEGRNGSFRGHRSQLPVDCRRSDLAILASLAARLAFP